MSQGHSEFDEFVNIKGNWEDRFQANKQNFSYICKRDTVEEMTQNLLLIEDPTASETQRQAKQGIIEKLRDLSLIIPSTLARLE